MKRAPASMVIMMLFTVAGNSRDGIKRTKPKFEVLTLKLKEMNKDVLLEYIVHSASGPVKAVVNSELVGVGEIVDRRIEILEIFESSATVRSKIRQKRQK